METELDVVRGFYELKVLPSLEAAKKSRVIEHFDKDLPRTSLNGVRRHIEDATEMLKKVGLSIEHPIRIQNIFSNWKKAGSFF